MAPSRRAAPSPRIRKLAIRLASAFLFFLLLDLVTPHVNAAWIVERLQTVSTSIEYAGRSLAPGTAVELVRARLSADRYHRAVLNLRAPFNLSEACRTGNASHYAAGLARFCTEGGTPLPRTLFPKQPPPSRFVDPDKYPRRWYERVIGIPDAVLNVGRCAWNGRDVCLPPPHDAAQSSNWIARLVIMSVALWAVVMATTVDWTKPADPPRIVVFVIALAAGLFYTSVAMMIIGTVVSLFLKIGVWVAAAGGTIMTGTAAKPLIWAVEAVKDIAADQAKDVIGRGLTTGTGSSTRVGGHS